MAEGGFQNDEGSTGYFNFLPRVGKFLQFKVMPDISFKTVFPNDVETISNSESVSSNIDLDLPKSEEKALTSADDNSQFTSLSQNNKIPYNFLVGFYKGKVNKSSELNSSKLDFYSLKNIQPEGLNSKHRTSSSVTLDTSRERSRQTVKIVRDENLIPESVESENSVVNVESNPPEDPSEREISKKYFFDDNSLSADFDKEAIRESPEPYTEKRKNAIKIGLERQNYLKDAVCLEEDSQDEINLRTEISKEEALESFKSEHMIQENFKDIFCETELIEYLKGRKVEGFDNKKAVLGNLLKAEAVFGEEYSLVVESSKYSTLSYPKGLDNDLWNVLPFVNSNEKYQHDEVAKFDCSTSMGRKNEALDKVSFLFNVCHSSLLTDEPPNIIHDAKQIHIPSVTYILSTNADSDGLNRNIKAVEKFSDVVEISTSTMNTSIRNIGLDVSYDSSSNIKQNIEPCKVIEDDVLVKVKKLLLPDLLNKQINKNILTQYEKYQDQMLIEGNEMSELSAIKSFSHSLNDVDIQKNIHQCSKYLNDEMNPPSIFNIGLANPDRYEESFQDQIFQMQCYYLSKRKFMETLEESNLRKKSEVEKMILELKTKLILSELKQEKLEKKISGAVAINKNMELVVKEYRRNIKNIATRLKSNRENKEKEINMLSREINGYQRRIELMESAYEQELNYFLKANENIQCMKTNEKDMTAHILTLQDEVEDYKERIAAEESNLSEKMEELDDDMDSLQMKYATRNMQISAQLHKNEFLISNLARQIKEVRQENRSLFKSCESLQ